MTFILDFDGSPHFADVDILTAKATERVLIQQIV